jgi:hypothetical protein
MAMGSWYGLLYRWCDAMRCDAAGLRKEKYIYRLWQVKVEVAKSVIQANLSEYTFVLGKKENHVGPQFETSGRLLACVRPRDRQGSCSCDWPLVGQQWSMSELRWRSRAWASEVVGSYNRSIQGYLREDGVLRAGPMVEEISRFRCEREQ